MKPETGPSVVSNPGRRFLRLMLVFVVPGTLAAYVLAYVVLACFGVYASTPSRDLVPGKEHLGHRVVYRAWHIYGTYESYWDISTGITTYRCNCGGPLSTASGLISFFFAPVTMIDQALLHKTSVTNEYTF